MISDQQRRRHRQRVASRVTLAFCLLTLLVGAACALLHFSPIWVAIPVMGALVSACFMSLGDIVSVLFGHRG